MIAAYTALHYDSPEDISVGKVRGTNDRRTRKKCYDYN
jgi:hypothetical protein